MITKKPKEWQVLFGICSLVYVIWVTMVATPEFDRLSGQYDHIIAQLKQERIRAVALEELKAECLRGLAASADLSGECSAWPEQVVTAREQLVEKLLLAEKSRHAKKRLIFYTVFLLLFLLAPPLVLYLLVLGIIRIFLEVKIVR